MLTFEDKYEITELVARYNYALDTGDGDAWAATFTEDGVFGTLTGTESLAEFARDRDNARQRHWTNNLVIDGEGREATLSCYLHVTLVGAPGIEIVTTGLYTDQLRRVDGEWKFARRELEIDR
jgi:hypothetical protein